MKTTKHPIRLGLLKVGIAMSIVSVSHAEMEDIPDYYINSTSFGFYVNWSTFLLLGICFLSEVFGGAFMG